MRKTIQKDGTAPTDEAGVLHPDTPSQYADTLSEYRVPLFPVTHRDKTPPLVKWSSYRQGATETYFDKYDDWREKHPGCNWAIATGAESGIDVVDADSSDIQQWCEENLPRTPYRVRTYNGQHLYYRHNPDVPLPTVAGSKLDTRGNGGYVMAPGSIHPEGGIYQPELNDVPLGPDNCAPDPDELPILTAEQVEAIAAERERRKNKTALTNVCATGDNRASIMVDGRLIELPPPEMPLADGSNVGEGERNQSLASLVGQWIYRLGCDTDALLTMSRGWNLGNTPPMDEAELTRTVHSMIAKHKRTHGDKPLVYHGVDAANVEPPKAWPALLPLSTEPELLPVPELRPEFIPDPMRPYIEHGMRSMGVPSDFIAIPLLAALGGIAGNRLQASPARNDNGYRVTPNFYAAIVAPPGSIKSPAQSRGTKPARMLEDQFVNEHTKLVKAARADADIAKREVTAMRKAIKPDKDTGEYTPEQKAKLREIYEREEQAEAACTRARVITNDATMAKMGELLQENPAGMIVERDELAGWFAQLARDDRKEERAFYLECWNGTGKFRFDRIGRGEIEHNATLTLIGGIQPERIRGQLAGMIRGDDDDGMLQRFQLMSYPDPVPYVHRDEPGDPLAEANVLTIAQRFTAVRERETPLILGFDKEAQTVWDNWYTANRQRLAGKELPSYMRSHLAKYDKLVAGLASIFQIILDPAPMAIGSLALGYAQRWAEYLELHAARVYALADDPLEAARTIVDRIDELGGGISRRELRRKKWAGGLRDPKRLNTALAELVHRGYLVEQKVRAGSSTGRSSLVYLVNPAALAMLDGLPVYEPFLNSEAIGT